jgi:hypothetical protein
MTSAGLGRALLRSVQCGLKARKELDVPERDVAKGGRGGGARSLLTRVRNGGRRYCSRTHLPRGRPAASEFSLPIVVAVRSSTAVRLPSQSRPCGFSIRHMERGATGSILGH